MRIAIPEINRQDNYYKALEMLGAEAVRITGSVDPAEFDGLLLPGGVDINPKRYGCENRGSRGINDELDKLQFGILDSFVKAGKPVLGICRGHQCLAAYFGLELIQHLPSSETHSKDSSADPDKFHGAVTVPGTLLERLYGSEMTVNSSHHQAVMKCGKGLELMAKSEDGVIEAMYHKELPIFSVQWHPERMCFDPPRDDLTDGSAVFNAFLGMCRSHSAVHK